MTSQLAAGSPQVSVDAAQPTLLLLQSCAQDMYIRLLLNVGLSGAQQVCTGLLNVGLSGAQQVCTGLLNVGLSGAQQVCTGTLPLAVFAHIWHL